MMTNDGNAEIQLLAKSMYEDTQKRQAFREYTNWPKLSEHVQNEWIAIAKVAYNQYAPKLTEEQAKEVIFKRMINEEKIIYLDATARLVIESLRDAGMKFKIEV